ncbi:hypothetical protein BHF70_07980 [Anaerostipes sp. 494a]|uniref:hypothetical protein n=1 Tax=unclassified Anaerostipes TaxID=2635253 RepID=UPI0009529C3F|nr:MULTISPECIES: hypothetical protein [unclassified Anaerostipes]MCI5623658.1 hypothetical protein [Anaerostipes sp.]MDY2725876.1 hypothetical protein [Anaerostipes faecalis]OLR59559.1 hypothetical protein BHF70_07980 [Anaerostipes sp. 494a]
MKKIRKILVLCSVCTLLFLSSITPVSAADSWAGFQDVTIGLSFGTLGKANFYTTVIPSKGTYYSTINMKLQRYSGGSWHTLTSGTYGDTGVNLYSRDYYVTKGYTYRVYSKATIYKSKGGAKINSDTFIFKRSYK